MKNNTSKNIFVMTTSEDTKRYLEGKGLECVTTSHIGKETGYYFRNSPSLFEQLDFSKMKLMYTDLLLF